MHYSFIEWDSAVHNAIQIWEDFYLRWLRAGKNILLVYYESLTEGFIEMSLRSVTSFLDVEWDDLRMKCISKYNKGNGNKTKKRKKGCINRGRLDSESIQLNTQTNNINNGANNTNSFNIYTKKHVTWINSAIKNVKHEIERRGLDSSYISNYEGQNVRVTICAEEK